MGAVKLARVRRAARTGYGARSGPRTARRPRRAAPSRARSERVEPRRGQLAQPDLAVGAHQARASAAGSSASTVTSTESCPAGTSISPTGQKALWPWWVRYMPTSEAGSSGLEPRRAERRGRPGCGTGARAASGPGASSSTCAAEPGASNGIGRLQRPGRPATGSGSTIASPVARRLADPRRQASEMNADSPASSTAARVAALLQDLRPRRRRRCAPTGRRSRCARPPCKFGGGELW